MTATVQHNLMGKTPAISRAIEFAGWAACTEAQAVRHAEAVAADFRELEFTRGTKWVYETLQGGSY
jgi:hypothetical protein